MTDVFISYSSADEMLAQKITQALDEHRITFFRASKNIPAGVEFKGEIRDRLQECQEVFLLLTPNSRRSEWVKLEYYAAYMQRKVVVPILLRCAPEDFDFPLNDIQARDYHSLGEIIEEFKVRQGKRALKSEPEADEQQARVAVREVDRGWLFAMKDVIGGIDGIQPLFDESLEVIDDSGGVSPFEFFGNDSADIDPPLVPGFLEGAVLIDTIHAGNVIPKKYIDLLAEPGMFEDPMKEVERCFVLEKDWGANQLALALTKALNLDGFYRVNIARTLLDYGRLPGITERYGNPLRRFAINYPFSYLAHHHKKDLLETCYDPISERFEKAVDGTVLRLAIHTFDKYNPSPPNVPVGTLRPDVSIVYSSLSYHEDKRMAHGVFDPMFPDRLSQFTADRRLAARITLNLEKEGITVAQNHPYMLPDGSVEVRAQVWQFFKFLKSKFEESHPDTVEGDPFKLVWDMLLDTNLRSATSNFLKSYIHMFRKAPGELFESGVATSQGLKTVIESSLEESRQAYEKIRSFLKRHEKEFLEEYRFSPSRPGALVIEVRKDILWHFEDDEAHVPVIDGDGLKIKNLKLITELLAEAILQYLNEDRFVIKMPEWS